MAHDPDSLLNQKFPSAAKTWLASKKPYLKEDTASLYEHHIGQLAKFFGELTVQKIHLGHLREYQNARLQNAISLADGSSMAPWTRKAGPSLINHELCVVQQVLKRAGCWAKFGIHYQQLPLPPWRPEEALTEDEEARLFDIASKTPEFELPYLVAGITNNTSAAGIELRTLRIKDVRLEMNPPRFTVRGDMAKNEYRGRTIALNDTAFKMMQRALDRAKSIGSYLPDHYLFPYRRGRGPWDPTRPASESWIKKSFKAMREAAGLPHLKPHHLRHQAITRMLELGIPDETVRNIAGHVSERMMRHYAHTRIAVQSRELDKIDPRHRKKHTISSRETRYASR